jgi:Predicted transcriptional regulators
LSSDYEAARLCKKSRKDFLHNPNPIEHTYLCKKNRSMTDAKPYSAQEEKTALYARALGHPARIFILNFLSSQTACFAGDISEKLTIANSTVSQHLKVLKEAGLIQGTINPPTIQYCINQANWEEAKALFEVFFNVEKKPCETVC